MVTIIASAPSLHLIRGNSLLLKIIRVTADVDSTSAPAWDLSSVILWMPQNLLYVRQAFSASLIKMCKQNYTTELNFYFPLPPSSSYLPNFHSKIWYVNFEKKCMDFLPIFSLALDFGRIDIYIVGAVFHSKAPTDCYSMC